MGHSISLRASSAFGSIAAVLAAACFAAPAYAQEEATGEEDIIVTGTLIRGIAPPGANVIGVTADAIEESGAASVAQILQNIPQLGSFGLLQQPLANSGEVAVNRPNLRSLPGFNTSGGSSTLVLMDGHRLVGMGVSSTSPDPDIIPPGVLERVEIVPDGGSAIYGSDAVAGVMNFITIKRFDGLKIDGSVGFADDYYQWDVNATAGKDWGSGSLFVSYNYAKTDELLGRDRDYVREYRDARGFTTLACGRGNLENVANGAVVGLPYNGGTTPINQDCDISDYATVFPSSERHSVFAGLTQQLDDTLVFDARAYYTNRQTYVQGGPYRADVLIAQVPAFVPTSVSSPFYGANNFAFAERPYFQWGPNDARHTDITLETWGFSPSFTKDLGNNFRLRLLGNYGESTTTVLSTSINGEALRNAIRTGAINPFNLTDAATPNAVAALGEVTNWRNFAKGRQQMTNARAIIDGDLFTVPGGAVKIAAGVEYSHETFRAQNGETVPGAENSGFAGTTLIAAQRPLPRFDLGRTVKSAFGELVIPLFSGDNATAGLEQLTVSAAARYDDYSDFGSTFNPRFGLTYKPVDWLTIRGAWGKSFNAPSLADDDAASLDTLFTLTGAGAQQFRPPAGLTGPGGLYPAYPATNNNIIALRGNKPGIEPQKATTWSFGFDMQPSFVPGLSLSVSYYNIDFKGFIGLPPFENPNQLWNNYGSVITVNDRSPASMAAMQAVLNSAFAAAEICRDLSSTIPCSAPNAATTYAFFDGRKQNVGDVKVDGIDFAANYRMDTSFGGVFFNANGTYTRNFKVRAGSSPTYVQQAGRNSSRFGSRATIGAEIGDLTAQATWTHRHGYKLSFPVGYNNAAAGFVQQSRVDSFNTIDLFFRYALKGQGLMEDLAFTLNVNNVLDQDPPRFIGGNSVDGRRGYENGGTLGRFVQFGVSKKF